MGFSLDEKQTRSPPPGPWWQMTWCFADCVSWALCVSDLPERQPSVTFSHGTSTVTFACPVHVSEDAPEETEKMIQEV